MLCIFKYTQFIPNKRKGRVAINRKVLLKTERLDLLFATEEDRVLLFQMAYEDPEVYQSGVRTKDDFTLQDVMEEDTEYFNEQPGYNKNILISKDGAIIGYCSYSFNNATTSNFELHIFFRSNNYTGKGLGTHTLESLIRYLHETYKVNAFVMRPWIRNTRAVKVYKKVGFIEPTNFDIKDYYDSIMLESNSEGYYGEETENMVYTII